MWKVDAVVGEWWARGRAQIRTRDWRQPQAQKRGHEKHDPSLKTRLLTGTSFTPANDSMDYLCMMWPFLVTVAPAEDSIARQRGYSLVIWEAPDTNTTPESRAWAWFWWAHWRLLVYSVSEHISSDLDLKKKKKRQEFSLGNTHEYFPYLQQVTCTESFIFVDRSHFS